MEPNLLKVEGRAALIAASVGRGDAYPRLSGLRRADRPAAAPLRLSDERDQVLARIVSLTRWCSAATRLTADITGTVGGCDRRTAAAGADRQRRRR